MDRYRNSVLVAGLVVWIAASPALAETGATIKLSTTRARIGTGKQVQAILKGKILQRGTSGLNWVRPPLHLAATNPDLSAPEGADYCRGRP